MEENRNMNAIKRLSIGVIVILSVIILSSCAVPEKENSWENSLSQEFKSLGLKGDLKVIDTTKEIEAFYGTKVKFNYTERLSDGYVLKEDDYADIHGTTGEHLEGLYYDLEIEHLLNDEEKKLCNVVKLREFDFLFNVYKKRPGFKVEEDKIKKDIAKKINELFNEQVTFDFYCKFELDSREKVCAAIISQAVKNRDNGDFEAAGFYNITPEDLMKNKGVRLSISCNFSRVNPSLTYSYPTEHIDIFKAKLLSLPKGSFLDGVYLINGSYYDDQKRTDFELICTFVVEDGIGHFEEDKIISEKKI
ncbi:hypothetical protein O3794_02520 [Gemella sanguinis]|uniref:hypothetical protein n=1 Tax=Gemella sanguinis TaxID=84135 RepID=UPI00352D352D